MNAAMFLPLAARSAPPGPASGRDKALVQLEQERGEEMAIEMDDTSGQGYNESLYNPIFEQPEHQRNWFARISFNRVPAPHAGSGSKDIIISVLAGNTAAIIVSNWLLVWTDHVVLLIAIVLTAALATKFVRDSIFSWIVERQVKAGLEPVIDRWNNNLLSMMDFLFHLCFFSSISLALLSLSGSSILAIGTGMTLSYIAAVLYIILHIVLLVGHGALATVANLDGWLEQPVKARSKEGQK